MDRSGLARSGMGRPARLALAVNAHGELVELTGEALAAVESVVADLERRRLLFAAPEPADRLASPRRTWAVHGLGFSWGLRLQAELHQRQAERGIERTTLVGYLDRTRPRVVADRGVFTQHIGALDADVRIALELFFLHAWRHPEWPVSEVWRHVAERAPVGEDVAATPAPAGVALHRLDGLTYLSDLDATKVMPHGGPKVLKVRDRTARLLVVKHADPDVGAGIVVTSVGAANRYRIAGVPLAGSWLAMGTERVGDNALRLGDVVEVNRFVDGREPTEDEAADELAGQFAITGLLADLDGIDLFNLRRTEDGRVRRIDTTRRRGCRASRRQTPSTSW
jgi:hypothetical protein